MYYFIAVRLVVFMPMFGFM
jgi:hypothetical protein